MLFIHESFIYFPSKWWVTQNFPPYLNSAH